MMRRVLSVICLLAVLASNQLGQVCAGTLAQVRDFGQLERVVLAELQEKNAPGAAVAIVSGDRLIFAKGFGLANVETGAAATRDTLFQIGSVTKTFTTTAVLALAEEGKLRLDAPVGAYIGGLSPKIANVTLHHLLSHTSGMIDEPDEYGGQDESMMASYLRSWKDDYLLFEAGDVFSYSNSGFALAGFAAQEASGKAYAEMMAERLFRPLGMTRTTFRPTVAMTYPLAVGHMARRGEKPSVVRPLPHDARLYPAGTMYSSVNEMARFAQAFLNDGRLEGQQLISPSVIARMQTPRAKQLSAADDTAYGYGLFMNRYRGVRQVWHEGSMTGYTASMLMIPEQRLAVIILCNANGVQLNRTQEKAMELMLRLAPKEESRQTGASLALSEAEMRSYVGVYEQPKRFKIEILMKENKLFIKEFNNEMALTKIGENRFAFSFPQAPRPLEIFIRPAGGGKPAFIHQYVWAFKRVS